MDPRRITAEMIYEKLVTQTKPMSMANLVALFDLKYYDYPKNLAALSRELLKKKKDLLEINMPDKRLRTNFYTALKK